MVGSSKRLPFSFTKMGKHYVWEKDRGTRHWWNQNQGCRSQGDSDSRVTSFDVIIPLKPSENERQKTRNTKQKNIVSRNISGTKQCLIRKTCFHRNMCETANQQFISSHMVVFMVSNLRCRWLMFRQCFVYRVRYPKTAHFEMQNRLDICLSDSWNTVYRFRVTQTKVK